MTRLKRLTLHHCLGIQDMDLELGDITEVTGENAVGKTSAIEGIKAILDGGKDATLVTNGETDGRAVLVIDEDDMQWVFEKNLANGNLTAKNSKVGRVGAAKTQLERLIKVASANPVEFLNASKKDRMDWVLRTLNVNVTAEEMATAAGGVPLAENEKQGSALELIARVHKRITKDREGVNRSIRDATGHIRQLTEALPAAVESSGISALRARYEEVMDARDKFVRACAVASNEAIREVGDDARKLIEIIQAEAQRKIDEVNAERAIRVEKVRAEEKVAVDNRMMGDSAELSTLSAQIATAEEQSRQAERSAGMRASIAVSQAQVEKLDAESEAYTAALRGLEKLKFEKSKDLPISGLEIKDGELYYNDVPFDRVNEAERYKLALKLCVYAGGNFVFIDGIERWDKKNREGFFRAALNTDVQFLVTRVVEEGALAARAVNK